MGPSTRPQYHLDLGHLPSLTPNQPKSGSSTAASSPAGNGSHTATANATASTFGGLNSLANNRVGAGSPSHDVGSRFYPRRAREIQASEGIAHPSWGPPTASGLSTPLRETIPESPGDDSFPDLAPSSAEKQPQSMGTRRARAGTVPSRFPPGSSTQPTQTQQTQASRSSRPTPSSSPFRPGTASVPETAVPISNTSLSRSSSLLSRFRAGSMPQRASLLNAQSPFGPSVFSTSWNGAGSRSGTLLNMSAESVQSPTQSAFMKDPLMDSDVKTLDYLGLADVTPQPKSTETFPDTFISSEQTSSLQPFLANAAAMSRNAPNRFRSFSVNATEKYASEDEEDMAYGKYYSGTLTPSAEATAAALAATQAQIHQHNLDVQAFASQASSSRPRARTVGLLDATTSRLRRNYIPNGTRLDNSIFASDFEGSDFEGLTDAVQALQLQNEVMQASLAAELIERMSHETTRALWLGNIPASTTPSSLKVIFERYGKIESARVLTHKSCGFVNFEDMDSAVRAKAQLNGQEIFPGSGPIRIGYAKAPAISESTETGSAKNSSTEVSNSIAGADNTPSSIAAETATPSNGQPNLQEKDLLPPGLPEIQKEIVAIVSEFGATEEEQLRISAVIDQAIQHDNYATEIPPIPEPSSNRIHDAPRLREIRKRIDNNALTQIEIEDIAMTMLPEIAELSSDYLGNTVVQKLFEYCSEQVKEEMLRQISPHLAEIGVHKNGTWAAQKIIDVARTPLQMNMVVESLRPYGVGCFLDQYGNYVMQCCLRFGSPWNSFIFETMLNRLWDIAQGRFGARAMRACLESHYATKDQQRMLAATIALHSVQLATNANGALLLTWFLDTCTFPHRRKILAPRLVPHLVHLCTHKVAYLTVLKIINQRNEPEARDTILQALFFSTDDQTLIEILKDSSCGATLIFKVLTTPFFEENIRSEVMQNIRKVLLQLKAQPSQGYKRLMDEVGLSTRSQGNRDDNSRPSSKHGHQGGAKANGSFNHMMANQAQNNFAHQMNGMLPNTNFNQFAGSMNPALSNPVTPQRTMQYPPGFVNGNGTPPIFNMPPQPIMNGYQSNNMARSASMGGGQPPLPPMNTGQGIIPPAGYSSLMGTPSPTANGGATVFGQYAGLYPTAMPQQQQQQPGQPMPGQGGGGKGRRGRVRHINNP